MDQGSQSTLYLWPLMAVFYIAHELLVAWQIWRPQRQWIIHWAADRVSKLAWEALWLGRTSTHNHHLVQDPAHMQELSDTPVLSQKAVYSDMFGFRYALHKLQHTEHNPTRSRSYAFILGKLHRQVFASVYERYSHRIRSLLNEKWATSPLYPQGGGSSRLVPLASSSKYIINAVMVELLFGIHLGRDPKFAKTLDRWYSDVLRFATLYKCTPEFFAESLWTFVSGNNSAYIKLMEYLIPIMQDPSSWPEPYASRKSSVWGLFIEYARESSYWDPVKSSQAMVGLAFAALHQPWTAMYFCIYELAKHPQKACELREEIMRCTRDNDWGSLDSCLLLDSFIKECFRHYPGDKLAVRRKALQDYQFTGKGPLIPGGSIACAPAYALMHDSQRYHNPNTFELKRFIPEENMVNLLPGESQMNLRMTEVSRNFLTWGYGSLACPGRWHVSFVYKIMIKEILYNFDIMLGDGNAGPRDFAFYSLVLPNKSLAIQMRRKEGAINT